VRLPPIGLWLKCRILDIDDADTITVQGPITNLQWRLRIKDCWAPETKTEAGQRAADYARKLLCGETHVMVHIGNLKYAANLLKNVTFDRVPAVVYLLDGRDYATEMIRAGHATKRKLKALTVKPRRTP
jgi:endonuclease YncB( thermonuclease family)